jgi:hypothetical protein
VTELTIYSGEEEFLRSRRQQVTGIGAAAGLAAAGLAGPGAGAALAASAGADSVEFFCCRVGGTLVGGRFSKVSFKNGDQLAFVVSKDAEPPLALAAVRRVDRLLWLVPHCSRGRLLHLKFSVQMFFWIAAGFPLFGMSCYLAWSFFGNGKIQEGGVIFMSGIASVLGLVAASYYSVRFYLQWLPVVHRAEQIFAELGYAEPQKVDMEVEHRRYCKIHGIKWPYLAEGPWIYHY